MIIKSMSRKQATFGQLIDYMEDGRQDKKFTLKHNLYSNKPEKIKKEFEENARYFKKRKNGVYMYHEVLSITKSNQLTDDEQKEKLREIALQYISKRSQNNLVYAVLHEDKKDNFHYHFLISSNEVEESKKHRLSKKEFDTLKKQLEKRVLKNYPELKQDIVINKQSKAKLSKKGAELKRRTGKTTQRDSVINRLKTVFNTSNDKQSFFINITQQNLEVYVRGKTIGVVDKITGRNHRLQTLGMLDQFNKISAIIESSETVKEKIQERKQDIKEHRKPYQEKIKIKTKSTQPNNNKKEEVVSTKNKTNQNKASEINNEQNFINDTVNKVNKTIKDNLTAEEVIEQRKQEMRQNREDKTQAKNKSSNKNKK